MKYIESWNKKKISGDKRRIDSVLGISVPLSTTLKTKVIKVLKLDLGYLSFDVGFGVRTPTT